MAIKPKRPCNFPGCNNLVDEYPYCPVHESIPRLNYDKARETATKRGYDTRWKKARAVFLNEYPLCVECMKQGRTTPADTVDHIIPCKGNTAEFWNQSNWQPLCRSCHSIKTATKDRGFGRPKKKKMQINANRKPAVAARY